MYVLEVRTAELIESLTQQCAEQGITYAAIVALIGAIDSVTVSTNPAGDPTAHTITSYPLPAEMTATGEIVDGKPHIHAVMAVQGAGRCSFTTTTIRQVRSRYGPGPRWPRRAPFAVDGGGVRIRSTTFSTRGLGARRIRFGARSVSGHKPASPLTPSARPRLSEGGGRLIGSATLISAGGRLPSQAVSAQFNSCESQ